MEAPVGAGYPLLERAMRVHDNALEWMPIFLPAPSMAIRPGRRFRALSGRVVVWPVSWAKWPIPPDAWQVF